MPPKLVNDEGDLQVLRPLSFCSEHDLARFAEAMRFPIIPCDLCGSQEGLQRNAMKAMLQEIESRMPGRKDTMIRALTNVRPSHLLDRSLFDFSALTPVGYERQAVPEPSDGLADLPEQPAALGNQHKAE